jgi:hypothetical protein
MCEEKDCECKHEKHHGYHHGRHHRHHVICYVSIVKRAEKQAIVPEVLLDVADIDVGDFLEISIRKARKNL